MKNLLKNLLGATILTVVLLGIISLVGNFVEWVVVDSGRITLALIIFGYVLYRAMKSELDK